MELHVVLTRALYSRVSLRFSATADLKWEFYVVFVFRLPNRHSVA